ncbi:ribosomal protein S18 acetylase RimI-like enzyme [Cytobacillus oceanisediminis]|jgi:ribosomal protein S18 acetylase RimI-like enzyme|uniref:Ribosomal protein S18 acetylase RimI-like enzyme n=1 Tax=Cytobacillus oceanisediminis TaxID=665099 RepID=A0A2V2ZNE7_9BACI|nr:GNAT family N-acetyltransferase [Cytobacillus oceanisediminis]PWW25574.1 ribosomal protein S18 acetylase RimI-like enzyme [Cytobacillus oceanisediminis]
MEIRLLQPDDAVKYKELRLEGLKKNPEAFGSSFEEEVGRPPEVYGERFKAENSFHFGAFEGGRLVGVVSLVRENALKMKHRANIYAMYVTEQSRQNGIGKLLVGEALEKARAWDGVEQIHLAVMSENAPAKKLYSSFGFEVYGKERHALKIDGVYYDEELRALYF